MKSEILGVKAPKKHCTDKKCPFHGELSVKKEVLSGMIFKKDAHGSATVEWKRPYYVPKYERYEIRRSRIRVHNPPCIDAQLGQEVLVARTRPLSKTKHHVIVQILKKEKKLTAEESEKAKKKKAEIKTKMEKTNQDESSQS